MDESPYRYDFKQVLGGAIEGTIDRAKTRARGAMAATDLALRGRKLTPGELAMIAAMFGTTRGFAAARVYPRNWWWPAPNDRPMTPEGNIFFPSQAYRDDYSLATVPVRLRAVLMHECTHLYHWYVLGQWVILRGLADRNYDYALEKGKPLRAYGLEQMGQIVEDYYSLKHGLAVEGLPYSIADYHDILPVRVK